MAKEIKYAPQGVRQKRIVGYTMKIKRGNQSILRPGDTYTQDREVRGGPDVYTIQEGTIGILHIDTITHSAISVLRDDCQAVRRALRNEGNTSV